MTASSVHRPTRLAVALTAAAFAWTLAPVTHAHAVQPAATDISAPLTAVEVARNMNAARSNDSAVTDISATFRVYVKGYGVRFRATVGKGKDAKATSITRYTL